MKSGIVRFRRSLYGASSFFLNHLVLWILLLGFGLILFAGFKAKSIISEVGLGHLNFLNFFKSPAELLDSTNNRTNFLLLGIRGEGSDSPDLTDTLLVFSYSHTDKTGSLISIPRDLWVNSLKTKINSVYHYGEFQEPNGGGIKLVQSAVLETLGLPIHYSAVVDFQIFRELIDLVGGVDVNVARSFTDTRYPVEGRENALPIESRFETVTFNAGLQHMDGDTALKFVRSRQAEGEEGTDIARDRRQQLVITALRQKISQPEYFLKKDNLISLYNLLNSNIKTNLDETLYPSLARLMFDVRGNPIKQIVLSYEPDETGVAILENPRPSLTYLNQWVLIAKDNNWPALAQYLKNKLEEKP